jgi:hypothetical protein
LQRATGGSTVAAGPVEEATMDLRRRLLARLRRRPVDPERVLQRQRAEAARRAVRDRAGLDGASGFGGGGGWGDGGF